MARGINFSSHDPVQLKAGVLEHPKKLFKPSTQTGICVKKGTDFLIKDLFVMQMRSTIISSQTRNREAFIMCVASSHQGVMKM